jgi:hypothetical protein
VSEENATGRRLIERVLRPVGWADADLDVVRCGNNVSRIPREVDCPNFREVAWRLLAEAKALGGDYLGMRRGQITEGGAA